MQEAGPSPFDEPPTTELTTNTELSGTPSPISGFVAPEVLGRGKSQMPQVVGILAVILSVVGVLLYLLALLGTQIEIDSKLENMEEYRTIFVIWSWIQPILSIVAMIIFGYAGLQLYNYKKNSIFIGLGAVALNAIIGLIGAYIESKVQENISGSADWGAFVGGAEGLISILCNGCCAILLVIPLMISPQDLE